MINRFYTKWPRKDASPTINNFKKTRDRIKKLRLLMRIQFFFQQDDTKIINFDEGILNLCPFFWGNVIFKLCPSVSKVTIDVPQIFNCLASPGANIWFPNRSAMARVLSLWRSIEKKGSESETSRQSRV